MTQQIHFVDASGSTILVAGSDYGVPAAGDFIDFSDTSMVVVGRYYVVDYAKNELVPFVSLASTAHHRKRTP